MAKHPMQPLEFDKEGVIRFKQNAIVRFLLASHPEEDLNTISIRGFSTEDYIQLMQLIGYSVSGFGDLDLVTNEELNQIDEMAEEMLNLPKREWIDCGA